jgi:exosortase
MIVTSNRWVHLAIAAIVAATCIPMLMALIRQSASNPYAAHIVIVPILGAVLLWVDLHQRRALTVRPNPVERACLASLATIVTLIAYSTGNFVLQVMSFIAAVASIMWWLYGKMAIRRAAFVLAFLLLMLPPPRGAVSAIAPMVQLIVAVVSGVLLKILQIPVHQHGVVLQLPELNVQVAEECAGLRFLLIMFVFMAAFARIAVPTARGQMALTILSIPVAVLANVARVTVTTIGAYAIGPDVITGPLHYYIGKSFWVFALVAMIGVSMPLRCRSHTSDDRRTADASMALDVTPQPSGSSTI